ncbi:hypothetical protein F5880DRAFT_1516969 [Lentinula raphanica]|nr:hypothetical protein F5880DRAFT_1516969 [Lentinula raphanica]
MWAGQCSTHRFLHPIILLSLILSLEKDQIQVPTTYLLFPLAFFVCHSECVKIVLSRRCRFSDNLVWDQRTNTMFLL